MTPFQLLDFDAQDCAVCYGDPSSAQTHGANLAIFTMLGVSVHRFFMR